MSARLLSLTDVRKLANELQRASIRPECATCECFQAFLTQLEIDGTPGAVQLLRSLSVPPDRLHPCLGCDPCPPAEVFADYLSGPQGAAGQAQDGCQDGST